MAEAENYDSLVTFWEEAGPTRWFGHDAEFDAILARRFGDLYRAAAQGEFNEWEALPRGALAIVILLDQIPRNLFRGTRDAYRTDATALLAAERAVERGDDLAFDLPLRRMFYMPFMHAEDLAAQERCVALIEGSGDTDGLRWAHHHRDIVARFGRFPHRNAILGRKSTPEEERFLEEDGFRG